MCWVRTLPLPFLDIFPFKGLPFVTVLNDVEGNHSPVDRGKFHARKLSPVLINGWLTTPLETL